MFEAAGGAGRSPIVTPWHLWMCTARLVGLPVYFTAVCHVLHKHLVAKCPVCSIKSKRIPHLIYDWFMNIWWCVVNFCWLTSLSKGWGERLFCLSEGSGGHVTWFDRERESKGERSLHACIGSVIKTFFPYATASPLESPFLSVCIYAQHLDGHRCIYFHFCASATLTNDSLPYSQPPHKSLYSWFIQHRLHCSQ